MLSLLTPEVPLLWLVLLFLLGLSERDCGPIYLPLLQAVQLRRICAKLSSEITERSFPLELMQKLLLKAFEFKRHSHCIIVDLFYQNSSKDNHPKVTTVT